MNECVIRSCNAVTAAAAESSTLVDCSLLCPYLDWVERKMEEEVLVLVWGLVARGLVRNNYIDVVPYFWVVVEVVEADDNLYYCMMG